MVSSEETYRLALLLILVGGFHSVAIYGLIGKLGLVLVYLGGILGIAGLIRSD